MLPVDARVMVMTPMIGPLTADEWAEFRYRDDDDLLQCCGIASDMRDVIFALLRNGAGREWRGIFAMAYVDMLDHPLPDGRGGELLARLREFYLGDQTDAQLRERVARIRKGNPEPADHQPRRGDAVAAWLKAQRDVYEKGGAWHALDAALDAYRDHADTGTPLGAKVHGPHEEYEETTDGQG